MQNEMESRWKKLEKKLKKRGLDAFLLTGSFNIFYLSGIWVQGAVLFTSGKKFFVIPPMYEEEVKKGKNGWEVVTYKNTLEEGLESLNKRIDIKKCGFESNHISFVLYNKIKGKFKPQLIPCNSLIEKLRAVKEKEETELIRKARQITISAFNYLKETLYTGITEKEVAKKAITYLTKEADGVSFDPIVLFGERTSLPHGRPSERKLKKNELVLIDIGAKVKDYCADITRTFVWGKSSKRWEKIYNFVKNIKQLAIQHMKPGVKASEIDEIVREEVTRAGYEKYLLHGTGHGVGLEVHEQPVLNRTSNIILEEGMIATVEPGVYFPGEGGIRIEDMVLVTTQGGRILL